jgi:hypothetical protein
MPDAAIARRFGASIRRSRDDDCFAAATIWSAIVNAALTSFWPTAGQNEVVLTGEGVTGLRRVWSADRCNDG